VGEARAAVGEIQLLRLLKDDSACTLQIIPSILVKGLQDKDPRAPTRHSAMLGMKKLERGELERAYTANP